MNFREELKSLEREGLLRSLRTADRNKINFSSNDYLNLSCHPHVKESAIRAIELFGAGAGGSRLMTGNMELHLSLETMIAALTGRESCLVFGSGYLANLGVLSALAGRNDVIFADRLNHSSLVAGAYGSGAEVRRYRHSSVEHLREMLSGYSTLGRKIIVTDSLFSMDGDIAPLRELESLAKEFGCWMVVDEAHAVGVFGKGGGICSSLGVKPDVVTGTMSKALGGYGGFAVCPSDVREYLLNRSKTFIYSTGLPPGSAGAAIGALEVLQNSESPGDVLLKKAESFRNRLESLGVDTLGSCSQIVPLKAGEAEMALRLSGSLEKAGIIAVAVRPPTVPAGTSRIRFSVTLAHSEEDIETTLHALGEIL